MTCPGDEGQGDIDRKTNRLHALAFGLIFGSITGIVALAIIWQTYSDRFALPDYGDLWRWVLLLQADGALQPSEVFSETSLFGHNQVPAIVLSAVAARRGSYAVFWQLGAFALATSAGLLAGFGSYYSASKSTARNVIFAFGYAIAGISIIRVDVPGVYYSSLLTWEQVYYLMSLIALLAAARGQIIDLQQEASPFWIYLIFGAGTFLGDAPGGLALIVGVLVSLFFSVIGWRFRHVGLLGFTALCVTGAKFLLRLLAGGSGTVTQESAKPWEMFAPSNFARFLSMMGASTVRLSGIGESTPDAVYGSIGVLVVAPIGVVLVCYAIRARQLPVAFDRADTTTMAGLLLCLMGCLAAWLIVDFRGLVPGYDGNRFVRSTEMVLPGLILIATSLSFRLRGWSRVPLYALSGGLFVVIAVRSLAWPEFIDTASIDKFSSNQVANFCVPDSGEIPWKGFLSNASDEVTADFTETEIFASWREKNCQ